ncbi:hypothetical protein GALMADRAFT_215467 [Galerina marginata CBS 339.88]|uniref:Uncharacterized protein n=1 Tax=Galerina marginata (strain CBS 339.88) TaxID=685588 RepID=A0A067SFV5_GALM3|nr:hypothetical protein GALMADRAFT_215467 [Galerina marginata CBS 339.88]
MSRVSGPERKILGTPALRKTLELLRIPSERCVPACNFSVRVAPNRPMSKINQLLRLRISLELNNRVAQLHRNMKVVSIFLLELQIAGGPPRSLKFAQETLGNALKRNGVDIRKQICYDFADLAHNAAQVEQSFATVQGIVNEFDGRDLLQNNEKFGARWEELHKRYSVTLGQSKASITELQKKIHEFVYVLLPILVSNEPDITTKLRHLEDFVKNITASQMPALELGNKFFDLKPDVAAFENDLDSINGNRFEWDPLDNNREFMHGIMDKLRNHTSKFDETTQKLSGMEGIWCMLEEDANSVYEQLKRNRLQTKGVRPLYEALESALVGYISAL